MWWVELQITPPKFVYDIPFDFVCFPFLQFNLVIQC